MKSKISTVVSAFIITLAVASAMTVYRASKHWAGQVDQTKETLSVTGNNASGTFGSELQIKTGSTEASAFLLQPEITCPVPDTVACDSPMDTTTLGSPTVMPDVTCMMGIDTIFFSDSLADFDCPNTYNLFRTWIVIDSCGLSDTCIQSIRVQDTTVPVITCALDTTIDCETDTSTATLGLATATDNCTDVVTDIVYRDSIADESCGHTFTIFRIWTATDSCGNASTCIQSIFVQDTTVPVITCALDTTIDCETDTSTSSLGLATATDNCTDVVTDIVYRDSIADESCGHTFTIFRIWTATDSCGNASTCIQSIFVQDTTVPVITCALDTTIDCETDTSTSSLGLATATDNCTDVVTDIVYRDSIADESCGHIFTIFRIWTATDSCGNASTCIQSIFVQDTTVPVITCALDTTIDCETDTSTATLGLAMATDNCTDVVTDIVYRDSIADESCGHTFTIFRIWTATDSCGNASTCIQSIFVQDTTVPMITCALDTTIDCETDTSTSSLGLATATDNCTDVVTEIVYRDSIADESCGHTFTIFRIWTATDSCGNASTCIQSIFVQDTTVPMITCALDTTIDCETDTSTSSLGLATATDNCTDVVTDIVYRDSIADESCGHIFTIFRIWTATDSCGNASTCIQSIFVQDTTVPVITCALDTTIDCETDTSTATLGLAMATDNCTDVVTDIVYRDSIADESCGHIFTIFRIWTATDSCGNASTCIQSIFVQDTTVPVITCALDTTIDCETDTSTASLGLATATDNCTDVVTDIVYRDSIADESCGHTFTIFRIWTATDSCGNASTCIQSIFVQDTTVPVITCALDTTIDCETDTSTTSLGLATATDNCTDVVTDIVYRDSIADESCGHTFTIFRIWTATDSCGNASTCIQSIFVQDTTVPVITCALDTTIDCETDTSTTSLGLATATDNCTDVVTDIVYRDSIADESCGHTFTIFRIWTATDSCGNASTCIQSIFVQDTTVPVITCPLDTLVTCFTDVPTVDLNSVFGIDNCTDIVIITHVGDSIGDSTCINGLTVFRTYRATDSCGNFNECIQQITVLDTEAPSTAPGTCPADTTITCDALGTDEASLGFPLYTDNCTDSATVAGTLTYRDDSTGFDGVNCTDGVIGTIARKFFVNDICGNTDSSCVQMISVIDTVAPMLVSGTCPTDTTITCDAAGTDEASLGFPRFTDNCTDSTTAAGTLTYRDDSTGFDGVNCTDGVIGTIARKFFVNDICGNTDSSCVQMISVIDTVPPLITLPPNIDTFQCGNDIHILIPPYALDNCSDTVDVEQNISVIDSTCPGDYKILLVFNAVDICGNTSEVRDTIIVIDTLDPILTCPGDYTLECEGGLPAPFTSLNSFLLAGGQVYDSCCLDSASFRFIQEILDCDADGDPTLSRYYAIDDCCGHSDTCIQVIAIPTCLLDLALRKTLNAPEPYFAGYGGTVPFTITVYNQFCIPADSIKIIEYLPSVGSSVIDPGWVNNGDGTACLLLTGGNQLPPGGLLYGDSVVIPFTVQLGLDFGDGTGINRAEIFSANTPDGPSSDVDSEPNNNPGDDIIVDDVIDNSGSDEDDYDIAQFFVCQPLVCNDHVNVSLEEDCELCFTADDFLEGGFLPEEYYTIQLFAGGKKLPGNCVDRAYLGYTLTYSVLINSPCGNNSCWGTVTIEDKAPPMIDCSPDTVLCFELSNLPSEGTVNDNCSGPVKVNVVSEQYIDYGCDSAFIQGVVKRRLIATDTWKNTVDCEKIYYVRRLNIEDLVCPRDTVIDCSLEVVNKVPFTHPSRSGAPTIEGIALWPNNVSCKVLTDYKDEISEVCGDGYKIFRTWTIVDWCGRRDTMCTQTIKVIDQTPPLAYDRTLPTLKADPHVCRAQIQLDTLAVSDCSKVIQTYSYPYLDEATGVIMIASGTLPARVWVTSGVTVIDVTLTDGCFNRSQNTITVKVVDETPPTPVCKEYTQVTVDPVSCWTVVKAKDLDNGSHDNCIKPLHFAVARMSDIEKARTDYLAKIEAECGLKEYKEHKAWYDQYIEDWINMYVFDDELHMDDCGENQVVLRVYEADSMPRLDPHIWKCGEHEWFCYNTYPSYRLVHNYHFFSTNPPASKDCDAGAPWLCKKASEKWFADRKNQFEFSRYYGTNDGSNFPQTRLYNDCMVKVIVDDKQPPVVDHLEDVTVYCDNAPAGTAYARQLCKHGEEFEHWPGPLSYQGETYGYYGGSDHIRRGHTDHQDPVYGCDQGDQWAPVYCRNWLYMDSFDQSGPVDPAQYFSTLVKFDKDRPARPLGAREFSITDNCRLDDTTMHFTDIGSVNGCGEGWFQRTWRIKDKCGNEVVAVQKVIIKHRSDFEVVFPADLEVTCDTENATDSSRTGKPEIRDDECEIIGVRYVDEISTIDQGDGACYKIIRTWTLIDWCIYDPNAHTIHPDVIVDDRLRANDTDRVCVFRNLKDNGDGFMKYVQIIKVFDHEAPVLNCRDTTICLTEGCQQGVNIPLEGADNCSEEVLYRLDITRPDGSTETRVNVNSISGNFTVGVYTIRIIGKDHCDNADTCTMRLTMRDCKEPTPYCLNGIATVVMPLTGAIEIWAKDLDRGSTDNCTANSALKFSFSSNVGEASRIFRCSDIPDGKQQAIPVDIWVTDQAGNQNYCRTYILLQDNGGQPGGVCKDTTLTTSNINGKLFTEDKEGVEFATVELKGVGQAAIPSFKTGSDGNFAFSNIQLTGPVSIKALRDDNPMNGLSTLDLVLLQKHLLGTEKLKSPYKMIAADINNSQDINVVDLVELRKLILGIYDQIPGNTSWKFIPKSHSFTDVQNPWGYPTEEQLDKMQETEVRDFVGVKIGDLNSSAVPHSLIGTEVRGNDIGLTLETEDRVVRKGEEVSVTFRSPNFRGISGWQGTLHTGGLQYLGVRKTGKLDLTDEHIGRRWAGEGMLTMSWHHHTGLDLDEEAPLFTLVFRGGVDGRLSEMLRFGSQHTIAESYEGKGELGGLSLHFVAADGQTVASRSELYQNYPNPFDQRTVIGINLEKEGKGVLRILDITGRTLRSIERDWSKGYQEVWLDRREIGATGVLYYRFESEFFTASRKMMIVD